MGDQPDRRTVLGGAAAMALLAGCQLPPTSPRGGRVRLENPAPMLPPVPAILLSVHGIGDGPDEVSVVWTFVVNGKPPQIGVSIAHEHVAQRLVAQRREFVLNVPVAGIAEAFDKVDMASHGAGDKYALAGLTRGRAVAVDAPTVEECPIQVECRATQTLDVPPARRMFVADVVATTVVEGCVTDDEMLLVERVPFFGMTAGSGGLHVMGPRVGHIGKTKGVPLGKYRY